MENILKNPKIWVAVVGIIATVVANNIPGFVVDKESAAAGVVILVVYLYGVLKDPGGLAWVDMLKSRKFWAAVIGEAAVWIEAFHIVLPYGLTYDQVTEIVTAVVASLILSFAHIRNDQTDPALSARMRNLNQ